MLEARESGARLRRTLAECPAGNADASALLGRHPGAVVRAVGEAIRRALAR